MPTATNSLSERVSNGEAAAVARAISKIEDGSAGAAALMKEIYQRSRGALVIGITGAPGAGKSSLVDKLAMLYRKRGERVGIVAVDPSSPFSGGAILGDRIRMQTLGLDEGVFIRSMATRGNLGGLARATVDAVAILDAAGYAKIIVETVGVGQDEVEIVKAADVSVVVLVPGMGDDIQAIKAGIMEIGDIFVINKADKEGVYATEKELESLLSLASRSDGWEPPIVKTVATENQGVEALAQAIESYSQAQLGPRVSSERRRAIARWRIVELLRENLLARVLDSDSSVAMLNRLADEVATRRRDPYSAVEEIIQAAAVELSALFLVFVSDLSTKHKVQRTKHMKIDHIGIATKSIEEGLAVWRDALGLKVDSTEEVTEQGVKVCMLAVGDTHVELLEPLGPETSVGKFLAKRGPGMHHIAIEVADIHASLAELKNKGARLIDETPRVGAGGCLVAFIHPSSANGVLLELVQHQ